jgi:hypothetical protein
MSISLEERDAVEAFQARLAALAIRHGREIEQAAVGAATLPKEHAEAFQKRLKALSAAYYDAIWGPLYAASPSAAIAPRWSYDAEGSAIAASHEK